MREAFISRYFSPAKFKRLLNDIRNSTNSVTKPLVEAWIHLKEMLRICYEHGLTKGTIVHIFYHGLDGPTQGILDAEGIFLYNTPTEAFQILEDKVLLKLDFSSEFQIGPKTIVSAGGSNINSYHAMSMEKFMNLVTKIDLKFLIIMKELKEIRDGHKDNHASQTYMKDDTPMCEPNEANYVRRYHGGYYDHEPINSYSYPNHNPNHHYPYP
nr:reverse transcriptase domain-containing protein [Tanacetum cinerariifolium]